MALSLNDARLESWGRRYGLTLSKAKRLRYFIDRHAKQQEHVCNGDPHPLNSCHEDKNRNAELWSVDSNRTAASIKTLAEGVFDSIDFGVGLYPAFAKGNDTCIMVP